MLENKNVVSKNDYDFYTLPLSWKVAFGRKKNNYIVTQLEKRHPCFSDDFYYGSKLRLKKKGVSSDVVVMNKLKLAEYQQVSGHKRLWFEEFGFLRNEVNVGKKSVIVLSLVVILITVLVLFLGTFTKPVETTVSEQLIDEIEEINPVLENHIDNLFELLKDNKGKINSLNIIDDGNTVRTIASVVFVYPEVFNSDWAKLSNVSYVSGLPSMVVSINEKSILKNQSKKDVEQMGQILKGVRSVLRNHSCELIQENVNPWKISCYINGTRNFKLVKEIDEILMEQNIGIETLNVKAIENRKFLFELSISGNTDYSHGLNLKSIYENSDLFGGLITVSNTVQKNRLEIIPVSDQSKLENTEVKLGEIIHKDGSKTIFKKNNNGKILKIETK
ncbi:MAG: hypothetical protein MJ188_07305 [Treponema sp.]|nr:hypothetical protein [Treponema sp.]